MLSMILWLLLLLFVADFAEHRALTHSWQSEDPWLIASHILQIFYNSQNGLAYVYNLQKL